VAFLKDKGHTGLFVGLDPSNEAAKKFYSRLGFERIDREGGEWWGLEFDKFHE
jgi:ribosomal protein S18 acetylase RimI-like enzyme